MKSPLRILHLEDDSCDATIVRSVLENDGIACLTFRVQTRDAFVKALETGGIDLVLSDFSMPDFDGLSATKIARNRWPDIPFIFVSGSLGEERGAAALESGATDYILKDDLARLAPAVRSAMQAIDDKPGEAASLTRDHDVAMFCLPVDGRWQTEAQLVAQTKLGNRTCRIYRDLVEAGFCERKIVAILCNVADSEDFMRAYKTTWKMRRAYHKHPSITSPVWGSKPTNKLNE
jgi:CheY-like chemotaxis protein